MNPLQESKQELNAAIRYAENAISSAKQTMESMNTYQEQTGREQALEQEVAELRDIIDRMSDDATGDSVTIKQLREKVDELKSEGARLAERYDEMKEAAFANGKTIDHLKEEREMLEKNVKYLRDENERLKREKEASSGPCGCQAYRDLEEGRGRAEGEVELLQGAVKELESKVQGQYDDIKMLERDLTVKEAQASAWKKKYYDFKEALVKAGDPRVVEGVSGVIMNKPTMPVIPKDVAIAIFREGVQHGVDAACTEIDNAADISIEENEYCGDFEVSFSKYIDLSDHLDTDWMRGKCGDYSEEGVIDALKGLCADKEFKCRIHGIDDQEEKKND